MSEIYKESYLNRCRNYPFRLYTSKETAELLRCSVHYVYKLCSRGILKPIKSRCNPGKDSRFTRNFFTDEDIEKGINFRFNLKALEEKIRLRVVQGKRLRF